MGRLKIIFAITTLDKRLKMIYNNIRNTRPILKSYFWKFHKQAKNIVFRGDSRRQEHLKEFTRALQRVNEDPNDFHIRLLNLAVQANRLPLAIDDYKT